MKSDSDLEVIELETLPVDSWWDEVDAEPVDPEVVAARHARIRARVWTAVALLAVVAMLAPIAGTFIGGPPARSRTPRLPSIKPPVPGDSSLEAVSFVDDLHGFGIERASQSLYNGIAVLGTPADMWFATTNDGGKTWNIVGRHVPYAAGVAFTDREHGVMTVNGHAARYTTDGGRHWSETRVALRSVGAGGSAFWAQRYIRCVSGLCDRELVRSLDGGHSWSPATMPPTRLAQMTIPVDSIRAYAIDGTSLWSTADGGATWQPRTPPCPTNDFASIAPAGARAIWSICSQFTDYAWGSPIHSRLDRVSLSGDGGRSWRLLRLPPASSGFRFTMVAGSAAVATIEADGRFYETIDGGGSWHLVTTNLERRQPHMLTVQAAGIATVTAGGFKVMSG